MICWVVCQWVRIYLGIYRGKTKRHYFLLCTFYHLWQLPLILRICKKKSSSYYTMNIFYRSSGKPHECVTFVTYQLMYAIWVDSVVRIRRNLVHKESMTSDIHCIIESATNCFRDSRVNRLYYPDPEPANYVINPLRRGSENLKFCRLKTFMNFEWFPCKIKTKFCIYRNILTYFPLLSNVTNLHKN